MQVAQDGLDALTTCESRYANIERELLGCKVIVETDHKPLVSIFVKSLNDALPRQQRMLLKPTKYDLDVRYVPGKQQVISDCISRAPLSDTEPVGGPEDVIVVNLVEELAFESCTLKQFEDISTIRVFKSSDRVCLERMAL